MAEISPALLEIGILFDAIAFIITFMVAYTSYRLYSLFRKPNYVQFSLGFLLMSTSYLFFALINFLSYIAETRTPFFLTEAQSGRYLLVFTEIRIVTMMLGLLILVCLYYDIREWKLRALFGLLMLFALFLGAANDFTFFMLSALFLFFIALKLYEHYRARPERNALLILAGFALLFVAKLLSGLAFLESGFLISYLFKLGGVLGILLGLWVISR